MMNNLNPALTAIIDYATALRDGGDDALDELQLDADAIFDLLTPIDRATFAELDLPDPIDRDSLDDLDRRAYDQLRTAYLALHDARP